MVELPQKKVGIVSCSGEELAEGTVTRLAALRVLETLRPADTVTICLPLFLAGGEGDRAFARFYPTIAVDGCELRCAARGTEMYSGKPAASVVVTELVKEAGLEVPQGCRRLNEAGLQAVELTAERVTALVDELLDKRWNRRTGEFVEGGQVSADELIVVNETPASCACGSSLPVQTLQMDGETVTLVALPLIFEKIRQNGKPPSDALAKELMEFVQLYNPIPPEAQERIAGAVFKAYSQYCAAADKEAHL